MRFNIGQRYMVGLCGGQEEMEKWIRLKVQEWAETIDILGRFAVRYLQTVYTGVAMLLQAE